MACYHGGADTDNQQDLAVCISFNVLQPQPVAVNIVNLYSDTMEIDNCFVLQKLYLIKAHLFPEPSSVALLNGRWINRAA